MKYNAKLELDPKVNENEGIDIESKHDRNAYVYLSTKLISVIRKPKKSIIAIINAMRLSRKPFTM